MNRITFYIAGALFAMGLMISGMTNTEKVLGFLDIFGAWDPTLLFVMVGAIAVHSSSYFIFKNRPSPFLSPTWHLPTSKKIDKPLLIGAALFGAGWGLAGVCPGPGLVALLAVRSQEIIVFHLGLFLGMTAFYFSNKRYRWK